MSIAAATAETVVTLYNEIYKLEVQLRQVYDGSGTPVRPGRFTVAEIDAQIVKAKAAIDAVSTGA